MYLIINCILNYYKKAKKNKIKLKNKNINKRQQKQNIIKFKNKYIKAIEKTKVKMNILKYSTNHKLINKIMIKHLKNSFQVWVSYQVLIQIYLYQFNN